MRVLKSEQSLKDLKQIKKVRAEFGLQPIKQGKRNCLRCDKSFYSYDLCNMKTCSDCREPSRINLGVY